MVKSTLSIFCHVTFYVLFRVTVPSSCILGYFICWHTQTHTLSLVLSVWLFCTVRVGVCSHIHSLFAMNLYFILRLFFLGNHSFSLHDNLPLNCHCASLFIRLSFFINRFQISQDKPCQTSPISFCYIYLFSAFTSG